MPVVLRVDGGPLSPAHPTCPAPPQRSRTFMWSKAMPTFSLKSGLKSGILA